MIDAVVLITTLYFLLAKAIHCSLPIIMHSIFQHSIADYILAFIKFVIFYSIVAKIVFYVIDYFRNDIAFSMQAPHHRCLLHFNEEIGKHIKDISKGKFDLSELPQKHTYEANLMFIHTSMAEHLMIVLKSQKLPSENLFISIFHNPQSKINDDPIERLEYVSHFDPTMHDTSTLELKTTTEHPTRTFAGIRAFKENKTVICANRGKGNYVVAGNERRKTLIHYVGIPLRIINRPVALLNIEFHNKAYFKNASELNKFIKKEIQAFVHMYEYQLHKKYFFRQLQERTP